MSTTDKLAMAGGKAAVSQDIPVPKWPHTLPADEHAVIEALRKGDLTSLFAGGAVEQLEEARAQIGEVRKGYLESPNSKTSRTCGQRAYVSTPVFTSIILSYLCTNAFFASIIYICRL